MLEGGFFKGITDSAKRLISGEWWKLSLKPQKLSFPALTIV
jgi:hypothetical protein